MAYTLYQKNKQELKIMSKSSYNINNLYKLIFSIKSIISINFRNYFIDFVYFITILRVLFRVKLGLTNNISKGGNQKMVT